jgi:hypothetical protein
MTPQSQNGNVADVNNDHTYHEVLFTEWLPRTFTMTATADFSVKEPEELGELVVKFNNVINLPAKREYRIWIEFQNSVNFDKTMGQSPTYYTMGENVAIDWV